MSPEVAEEFRRDQEYFQQRQDALLQACDNPDTAWALDMLWWISLAFFILCLIPGIRIVWKTASPKAGLGLVCIGIFVFLVWLCFTGPDVAERWTGDKRSRYFFPEGLSLVYFVIPGGILGLVLSYIIAVIRKTSDWVRAKLA